MPWTPTVDVSAGSVLTASRFNEQVLGNLNTIYAARRLAYGERTSAYTVNQSTVANATDVFTSDLTFTAAGSTAYRIEWFFPYLEIGNTTALRIHLVSGAGADLGWLGIGFAGFVGPAQGSTWYTPAAGSVSINLRATNGGAGTGALGAGAGGAGVYVPGWLAVYGPENLP